jgi:hypothetical protein
MSKPRIAVVGAAGVVGTAMRKLCGPETVAYDLKPGYSQDRNAVNACDAAFVCVPTPTGAWGACDTSIVEQVVSWIEAPLIILRSTVASGTTDRLRRTYGKRVVFQAGVAISMDGRGRALDNVFVERLWWTVEYEEVYLKDYAGVPAAVTGLGAYFNFYNGARLHQALGYQTPQAVYLGLARAERSVLCLQS